MPAENLINERFVDLPERMELKIQGSESPLGFRTAIEDFWYQIGRHDFDAREKDGFAKAIVLLWLGRVQVAD